MNNTHKLYSDVDQYFEDRLIREDPLLNQVLANCRQAKLVPHHISPLQGKWLMLLIQIMGAKRILEIGTLGAYSTIWMARALPPEGTIISLERDASHIKVAQTNLQLTEMQEKVDIREGLALDSLAQLVKEQIPPFDFVFIDADKPNNPNYLRWILKLVKIGSVIIADNVVREGAVLDSESEDPKVRGVQEYMEMLGSLPGLNTTAIQTVGCKGYDGFAMTRVEFLA